MQNFFDCARPFDHGSPHRRGGRAQRTVSVGDVAR